MDFNSFLAGFGMKPSDFSRVDGPAISDDLVLYEAWEARKDAACPSCGCRRCHVKRHYSCTIRARGTIITSEELICHRIVYICTSCSKTFTIPIAGVEASHEMTYMEKQAIIRELNSGLTFSQVANAHRISVTEAVRTFDEAYPEVRRLTLPRILCIDEFKFDTYCSKYACHLVDFERSETVDVIRSRQKSYLDEYFSSIAEKERCRVRFLITDMYDEYAHVARAWLPNASVVVDRFHVVKQLTEAVNSLRVRAMSSSEKGSPRYNFMKSRWRLFLCRPSDIPDKWYTSKSTGESWHYDEMVRGCIRSDRDLLEAYDALQCMLSYMREAMTYSQACREVDFLSTKLLSCSSDLLRKVGSTYSKWRNGIAMGIARNEMGAVLSNGKMEAANDVAQTVIDSAYGYRNFERFRKRFMLIRKHKGH